jgi:hypothetical protein
MFKRPYGIRLALASGWMRFYRVVSFMVLEPIHWLGRFLNSISGRSKAGNVVNRSGNNSPRKEPNKDPGRIKGSKTKTAKEGFVLRPFEN